MIGNPRSFLKISASLILMAKIARLYLDPSSGSFILQVLIAGLLGGLLTVKLFWGRIKSIVTGTPPPTETSSTELHDKTDSQ
jgi:hypothetical protein